MAALADPFIRRAAQHFFDVAEAIGLAGAVDRRVGREVSQQYSRPTD